MWLSKSISCVFPHFHHFHLTTSANRHNYKDLLCFFPPVMKLTGVRSLSFVSQKLANFFTFAIVRCWMTIIMHLYHCAFIVSERSEIWDLEHIQTKGIKRHHGSIPSGSDSVQDHDSNRKDFHIFLVLPKSKKKWKQIIVISTVQTVLNSESLFISCQF